MIDFQKQQKKIIEELNLLFILFDKLNSELAEKVKHDFNSKIETTTLEKDVTFLSIYNKEVVDKLTSSEYKDLVVMSVKLAVIQTLIAELRSDEFKQKTINIIDKFYQG